MPPLGAAARLLLRRAPRAPPPLPLSAPLLSGSAPRPARAPGFPPNPTPHPARPSSRHSNLPAARCLGPGHRCARASTAARDAARLHLPSKSPLQTRLRPASSSSASSAAFFFPPQALERSGACRAPAVAPSTSCRLARESRSVRRAVGLGAHACAHVESPENAGQGRQEKANRSFF